MKRILSVLTISTALSLVLSSCYSHKYVIGNGPQTGVDVTEKNNFFVLGLIPGKVSDPQKMAGDAQDFEVTEVQTFVDGLLGVITFGIYTPTTTKVQK
jgi:hypothetical protein